MVSDSNPNTRIFNGACLEVKARDGTKEEQIAIAFDDEVEDNGTGETIVDLVDSFKLNEIKLAKADFMAYFKNFLKAVTDKLTSRGKADRIGNESDPAQESRNFHLSSRQQKSINLRLVQKLKQQVRFCLALVWDFFTGT